MPSIQEKLAIISTANSMEKHTDAIPTSPTNPTTLPQTTSNLLQRPLSQPPSPQDMSPNTGRNDNLPPNPNNLAPNPDNLQPNPNNLVGNHDNPPAKPEKLPASSDKSIRDREGLPLTLDKMTINPEKKARALDHPSRAENNQSLPRNASSSCCLQAQHEAARLEQQKLQLEVELQSLERAGEVQGQRFHRKLQEADRSHGKKLEQIKEIITDQRKVGDRWKEDMMGLTNKFDTKVREATYQNKQLRSKIEALNQVLAMRKAEAEEATELMGIYSSKIKKVNETIKRESNRSDESYIEITLPMPFGVL